MNFYEHTYKGHEFPFNWKKFHSWMKGEKRRNTIPAIIPVNNDVRTIFACEVMNQYHSTVKK